MLAFNCSATLRITFFDLLFYLLFAFLLTVGFSLQATSRWATAASERCLQSGHTLNDLPGESQMARNSSHNRQRAERRRRQIELLEPRMMFAATPYELPLYQPGGLSDFEGLGPAMEAPLVLHGGAEEPPLEQHGTPPLTNFLWQPMVYAGTDASVNQGASLQLAGEVMVNHDVDLLIEWSKVSGPGDATFGNSGEVNTSVQFDQAGTYELELRATNAGVVVIDRLAVTVNAVAANVINIDQAWLDIQGEGPYYLAAAGYTYVLQTDVTTDGTAFAIIADNVTFDLNGHTITYNNAAPIEIPNGSFEQGTGGAATGWDFANAPNAERFAGEFLENEIYDGQHSLHFTPGFTGTQTVTSTGTITLEANTTYSLSAMMSNAGWVKDMGTSSFVRLVGQNTASEHEILWTPKNNRGIQFREVVFTTGDTAETYKIVAGANNPNAVAGFEPCIDDIKVQRTKVYGIASNIEGFRASFYPDLDRTGAANAVIIKNGTVIQGSDNATNSHGVYAFSTNAEIANMTITVGGANSNVINGHWSSQSNIHHNTLISNVRTIQSRDLFHGAVIYQAGGSIHHNTIVGGPHTGILTMGTKNEIYDNQISIRSYYTNGFAINAWNDQGSKIYGNTIELTTEDFGGRGIMLDRKHDDAPETKSLIYDNTVKVREMARNQEYRGAVLGGAYGIQLEKSKNVEIYGNTVEAIADESAAYALRLNHFDESPDHNVDIYNNTFRAILLNPQVGGEIPVTTAIEAFAIKLDGIDAESGVSIRENVMASNYGWLGETKGVTDLLLSENAFKVEGDGTGFIPIQGTNYNSNATSIEANAIKGLRFIDSVFFDELAKQKLYNEPIDNLYNKAFGGVETHSWFFSAWSTTFLVRDAGANALANASVSVRDGNGLEIFAGNTDGNGRVSAIVNEFKIHGADKTLYGPYTVTAELGGIEVEHQFAADRAQTIELSLAIAPNSTSHEQRTEDVFWVTGGESTFESASFLPESRGDLEDSSAESYDQALNDLYSTPESVSDGSIKGKESKPVECGDNEVNQSQLFADWIVSALEEDLVTELSVGFDSSRSL